MAGQSLKFQLFAHLIRLFVTNLLSMMELFSRENRLSAEIHAAWDVEAYP